MLFEYYLEDFVWHSICQVREWLVCFDMLPGFAAFTVHKFYCNGCIPFAPVVLPLCNFSPVCFASLVKKSNHPASALFRFGCSIFLARKARCKPDVLKGGSVPFCVGLGSSLIDVAMQAGPNTFVTASSIHMPCRHDLAVHFCQLKVDDDPCQLFGRRAKCK